MDRDELIERLETATNEWREVAVTATNTAEVIDQAKDALDAELSAEALADALSTWNLIDYSGPDKEEDRIKELDALESALDDARMDALAAEEERAEAIEREEEAKADQDDAEFLRKRGVGPVGERNQDDDGETDEEYLRRVKPFLVGLNMPEGNSIPLRRFKTHNKAAKFIASLEGASDGRYFLDGPEVP